MTQENDPERRPVDFTIPARYYARRAVDWDNPAPEKTCGREKTRPITLNTANTAVIGIHYENGAYPGGVRYMGEPGVTAYYETWAERNRVVLEENISPLLAAAREVKLRILYMVMDNWPSALHSPQLRQLAARTKKSPPEWQPPAGLRSDWKQELQEDLFGRGFHTEGTDDIAASVAAQPGDWMATSAKQASTLFSENGIGNLLLTGFEGASCYVWHGVLPLARLGYRCFMIDDGTLCLETSETRSDQEIMNRTFQAMQLIRYCYLVSSKDVISSMYQTRGQVKP